jgi:DNA-binding NtrC family response regulator
MNSIRVLLIEDNPGDARLINEMLSEPSSMSTDLVHDSSINSALKILEFRDFDIILLDLSLPDSSGLDSLEVLHKKYPDIPIVILTGFADEETAVQAVKAGAQDYLYKSELNKLLLIRTIRYALERRTLEREKENLIEELKKALNDVKKLRAIFPICANCKKIRDDKGYWNQIEQYLRENAQVDFSHTICPECKKKLYPGI